MSKHSAQWKKFTTIYKIIDKKTISFQIKIADLKQKLEEETRELLRIDHEINEKKILLNNLAPSDGYNGIAMMFLHKGAILSNIDSLSYEYSLCQQNKKKIYLELVEMQDILNSLEKRKLAIEEVMKIYS